MGDHSTIEWTEATWNPSVRLVPERLEQPFRWHKPRLVFVNSMSDLFHDAVPDEFIAEVFSTMGSAGRHTFQVLTKRPGRMASWMSRVARCEYGWLTHNGDNPSAYGGSGVVLHEPWPLPNVWLGTSVENQKWADVRIPKLLQTPAAVRFLSCEPLLGPVDLGLLDEDCRLWDCGHTLAMHEFGSLACGAELAPDGELCDCMGYRSPIDWVIVGGESGPQKIREDGTKLPRPMHPDWALSLRDQCVAASVPFFFKQWGAWGPAGYEDATHLIHSDGRYVTRASATMQDPYGTGSGPQDLVDRGHPGWARIRRFGNTPKAAGRFLDGRTWDEMPAREAVLG
jgi:protein gp37